MHPRFICSLLLLIALFAGRVYALDVPWQHFTIENGLPSNTVYDVYQDDDGFIWIGTDKGVARYNGRQFEVFTTADGLSDNECFYFRKDLYGRLWLVTSNGKLCYYKDGVFHNETNTPFLKLNSGASLLTIMRTFSDSSIVFTLHDDGGFFEIKGEQIWHYTDSLLVQEWLDSKFKDITKTPDGLYKVYYSHNKVVYDGRRKQFSLEPYTNKPRATIPYGYGDFVLRNDNLFRTKEERQIALTDPSMLDGKMVYKMCRYDGMNIFATNKGLLFEGKGALLENEVICSFSRDRNGSYWIATAKNGAYRISSAFLRQRQYQYDAKQAVIFAQRSGRSLFFTTSDRNIYHLDMDSGHGSLLFDYTATTGLIPWKKSVSWAASGQDYYNLSGADNFRLAPLNRGAGARITRLRCGAMIEGVRKKLETGSYVFLQGSNTFYYCAKERFTERADSFAWHNLLSRPSIKVYSSAVDERGDLWFSFSDKVYRIADTTPVWQQQMGNRGFREMIFLRNCLVGITHQNQLLVSGNYRAQKAQFKTIDGAGCVWDKFFPLNDTTLLIATDKHFRILKIERTNDTPVCSLSTIESPLIPYQPDYVMQDSGYCYFFARNSLSVFPVDYLLQSLPPPDIRFSFIKTSGVSIYIGDTVKLGYSAAQNIQVLFTAVSEASSGLSYEYAIASGSQEGIWYPLDNEDLNLVDLGYGGFHIKVRAKTSSGAYSAPSSFYLYVARPWWASWWFRASAALCILLAASGVVYLWMKAKLKKKESDIAFLKSEYKYLNALMNPHFIFNALNGVQGLVNNEETAAASKYIRIFSDLIRQNMHNIARDLISLEQEIQLVENYIRMEQLRLDNTLSYHIHVQEGIAIGSIMIPPLLIQPLAENAIKHGIWPNVSRKGVLELSIYEQALNLLIEIKDNGKGFTRTEPGTQHLSYALGNLEKRLHKLSMIHGKVITISVTERADEEGNILGVTALLTIERYREDNTLLVL
jgi:hypothetical protein